MNDCAVCAFTASLGPLIEKPPDRCWNCGRMWLTRDGRIVPDPNHVGQVSDVKWPGEK